MWSQNNLCEMFKFLFYGPGWGPGKPRLGLIDDIPDVCTHILLKIINNYFDDFYWLSASIPGRFYCLHSNNSFKFKKLVNFLFYIQSTVTLYSTGPV